MKVSQIGEFGLIELLTQIVSRARSVPTVPKTARLEGYHLLLGIGDDAAVWRAERPSTQLATTDTLVQGVHFNLDSTTWSELGWKSIAVNLSDIAAMGAIPKYALVTLGLPADTEVESVAELYRGMTDIAGRFDVEIVGGDVIRAPVVVISVTVFGGTLGDENILTRSAAAPGDWVAVTGHLGSSAAGLRMSAARLSLDQETAAFLREAHLRPWPRVEEGQILVHQGIRAAIDLSDGLLADLTKICQASRVGARVVAEHLPIHPLVRGAFQDSLVLALSGGEDYELLFTAKQDVLEGLRGAMPTSVNVIGEIVAQEPGQVVVIDREGNALSIEGMGWDHFAEKAGDGK